MADNNKQQKSRRRKKRPLALTIILRFFQTVGTLILVGAITGSLVCCYAAVYIKTVIIPNSELDMSGYTMAENSIIYYYGDDGSLVQLAELSGSENRQWVDYEEIPQDLINAFVAIEDKRFWEHDGVDWYRTAGALVNMFFSMRNTFGGSTITQQLVKNVTEYDDGTVKRKIVEIFTALDLENNYEKEDILTWYLNEIYLGNGCYGVQAAAQAYFGKNVSDLTLAECASLAGITNNPSLYGPYSTVNTIRYRCQNELCLVYSLSDEEPCETCGQHNFGPAEEWDAYRWNKARQESILKEMAKADISPNGAYITESERDAAIAEELVFARDMVGVGDGTEEDGEDSGLEVKVASHIDPWYVDAVIAELIADLVEQGYSTRNATNLVYSGGLSIITPYDPDVQAAVDKIYNDRSNLNYVSKTGQQMTSGITVIDNENGHVVAIAGDIGEKTVNRGWNNAMSNQQPGSSIKPLSVYAPALEMGLITPATISDDNPKLLNNNPWPANLPRGWRGLTTISDAVVRSVNTIAVNVLEMVTTRESYNFMTEKFGFTSLVEEMVVNGQVKSDITDLGALSMGGLTKGVSTFEMAAAFATFPRNGAYTEPTTYLIVKDYDGNVIIDNTPTTEFVIKESTAYYINSMLTDVVSRGTGTAARISGQLVAGKTGTTNDVFDKWFVGYTAHYTAAVWTGYPYDEYMSMDGNPAVTLWKKVMTIVHEDLERETFYEPDGLRSVTICLDCGNLATSDCANDLRGDRTETFKLFKDDRPTEHCVCHVPVTICTECPILDEKGEETGAYYLAGEFCPEESVKEITMVDYERSLVKDTVKVTDSFALMTFFDTVKDGAVLEDGGEEDRPIYCPLHANFCKLTVNWVDEEGNLLAEELVTEMDRDAEYVTEAKTFEGYVLKETQGDAPFGVMDSDKSVTYVYTVYVPGLDPDPDPSPEPDPGPGPEPDPEPTPDPAPEPTPEPTPEPAPEPDPSIEPAPEG